MGKQWQANGPWSEAIQRKKWRSRCANLDFEYPHLWPSNFRTVVSFANLGLSAEAAAAPITNLQETFRRMNEQIAISLAMRIDDMFVNGDGVNE